MTFAGQLHGPATHDRRASARPIRRRFPGRPDQVRHARDFVARQIRAQGCPHGVLGDIALCVSEAATNAIEHTTSGLPGGYFSVTVQVTGTTARVEIADNGPRHEPVAADAEATAGGWGLRLVSAHAQRVGTVVWFECTWGALS